MKSIQSLEVYVGFIHDIEGVWFRLKFIKLVAVMLFAISDVDIGRYTATKVKECVHFDRAFTIFPNAHVASLMLVEIVVESNA